MCLPQGSQKSSDCRGFALVTIACAGVQIRLYMRHVLDPLCADGLILTVQPMQCIDLDLAALANPAPRCIRRGLAPGRLESVLARCTDLETLDVQNAALGADAVARMQRAAPQLRGVLVTKERLPMSPAVSG